MFRTILAVLCFFVLSISSAFASTLENDLAHSLSQGRSVVTHALAKIRAGQSASAELTRLNVLRDEIAAISLLQNEQSTAVATLAAKGGSKGADRHQTVSVRLAASLAELLARLDAVIAGGNESALADLLTTINQLLPAKSRPLLGSLPYKHPGYPAREPATTPIVLPAFRGGDRIVKPADTASAPEAPLSAEIIAKAKELQWNPVLIYEWVKNNITTEWYWGAMKGAEETLRQKSGNDADQAALVVALMRAAGFPSRYVKGTIEFFPNIDKAKSLTGIDDPLRIAAFFQKAGIPFKPVIAGGVIANLQMEHIWVECEIPYSNSRGAINDGMGKTWLGLDTSIKPPGLAWNTPLDLTDVNFATVRDDYLRTTQTQTPLEFLKAKAEEQLALTNPGKTYQDLLSTRSIIPDILKIIPSSLQFKQIAISGEYTELPLELKQQVRFTAKDGAKELFSISQETQKLSNQKITLTYEPETVEDQNIINGFGGLDNTPSYLVHLRPVLKLNNERLVVAEDGLPMGAEYTLDMEVITPSGTEQISNTHIVGNLSVIGIVAQSATQDTTLLEEDDAETILFKEANSYINRWNRAEDELAALLKIAVSRPTPTIVTVGGLIDVTWLMDIPHDFQWKGVFMDAALRRIETVSRSGGSEPERSFMRLSALQGSILENRIFEEDFKVDSVSTAKLLQLAASSGAPVVTIDRNTIDTILPTLPFDEAIKEDIGNAVNQGLTVTIPQTEVAHQDWSGIGYIKENKETGESGWMLSGQVAGGMTAWRGDLWPKVLAAILENAYSEQPSFDPATAEYLQKMSATDFQTGEVGKTLSQKLQVRVFDKKNIPVAGVDVTFTVKAGGGLFSNSLASITVTTDNKGKASAALTLGKYTRDNATFVWNQGDDHTQQVGENIVEASLFSGVGLPVPFTAYGFPGKPVSMKPTYGDGFTSSILTFASFVGVELADEYGNPISNIPVEFSVNDPVSNSASSCFAPSEQKTYFIETGRACVKDAPVWGECGDTSRQKLLVTSGSFGATVQLVLGGTPDATYKITATCVDQTDPAHCIEPASGKPFTAVFNRYTHPFGNCSVNKAPESLLFLEYVYTADASGRAVNAGKAGTTIPLQAKLFFLREGEQQKEITQQCDSGSFTCSALVGNRQFTIDTMDPAANSLNSATVTFDGVAGERLPVLPDLPERKGIYTSTYPLKPGVNKVPLIGTGTMGMGKTVMACPSTCSSEHNAAYTRSGSRIVTVYGVDITLAPIPPLATNGLGELTENLTIGYTIDPPEYKALSAYVVIYKNGEPVNYIPAETSGQGFATIAKGYWFYLQDSYTAHVVLNLGTGAEISSAEVPLALKSVPFALERTHLLSQFDAAIPTTIGSPYTDSYKVFAFHMDTPAKVTATLLDADYNPRSTIVSETSLQTGDFNFVVDYELARSAGFSSASPTFYLKVRQKPDDGSPERIKLYPGRMIERSHGKMLGQTMVHDVLIQDGSLNLSRQDFAFAGRGPGLAFSRSYNNQSSPAGHKPLGEGWSHSLDLRLQPISSQSSDMGAVPVWVNNLKGRFYGPGEANQTPQAWTVVAVNGATFKKVNGAWYAERGRHGSLTEESGYFVYTAKDGSRYKYDYPQKDATPVKTIEDRNGNVMTFAYDATGRLSTVTDATGRNCGFSHKILAGVYSDDNSRIMAITCSGGVALDFAYNGQGYLESVKRGARIETYTYQQEPGIVGGDYNLVKTTDANNHSYQYQYHLAGEVSANLATFIKFFRSQDVVKSVTYPGEGTIPVQARFAYDTTNVNKRTVTNLRSNDTTYTLNYFGNPQKIEEPLGKTTLMTWSIDENKPDNVMTSRTDGKGYTTTYEYDSQGNIRKETDPYNKIITTVWNQQYSLPESRTDRNNVTRSWQYDPKGNLLQETDGDNKQSSHTYYATGERQTSRDPRGNTTSFSYNSWGNPASVTGAEGSLTRYEHDIRGRQTALIDPNGRRTETAYDDLDQPTTTTWPQHGSYPLASGSTGIKSRTYDSVGNLLSETDRLGLTLTYSYTPRNQVKTITRSSGGTKTFDYDNNGNLTSESDWKGIGSSHTYDVLNRRTASKNRLGHEKQLDYDNNGNLTRETDAEGRITSHEYDKLNRLTKTIQPALPGQTPGELTFSYYDEADPKTNLKSETDQEGNATSYEYNGRYLRSKRTNALLDTHLWEYDDTGNLNRETDEEGHSTRHEYDRQNRLTADIRSHNGTDIRTTYGYDAAGNRTLTTDPLGNTTTTKYDEWNRPWQIIDAENYTTTSELDGEGNKVRTVDANGGIRVWTRDSRGLVTRAVDAESNGTSYAYDLNNNPETVTYANGSISKTAYDAEDRKLLTTEAQGQPEERISGVVLYDKVGNPLKVKDGNGNITISEYNALNLPVKITDAKGKSSSSDYYKTGKIKTATNRRSATTTTEYDKLWRVTKVTDPLTQAVESTYDKVGNILQTKDKRGIIAETIYDGLYRPIEKKRANQRLVTMEYDNAGNLTADIDANNNRTEYTYSKRNQKEKTSYADTTSRSMTYDGNGNLITETDEEGVITSHGYDKENRPTATERAGELTRKNYESMGNLAAIIHPEGNSRTYSYDLLKRLTSVSDDPFGANLTTSYEYDKNNNRTKTIDPRGNVVENAFDELNRTISHTQKKAGGDLTTSYGYDEEGNLTSLTDAKGQGSTYVYDLLNRKTESHYSGLTITSGYDENNNIIASSSPSDSTANTYDNFDRLLSSTQRGTTVSYSYDSNGNRLSVGTSGNSTGYSYDARNRVTGASAGSAITSFDYYADGKKKTVTYPNGAKEEYEYFLTNRIKTLTNSLNSSTISKFDYSYDKNGNRLTQDESRGARTIGTTYSYDSLDRMTSYSVTENSATTRTDYTFEGYNRKTETVTKPYSTNITKTYTYDETDWLTLIDDGTKQIAYGYDNNGNTTNKADSSAPGNDIVYEYDARDKLTRTTKGVTLLGSYAYNANGYRIRQNNSDRGDVDYYYDGTAVIEERNGSGLLAHYRYANKLYSLFDGASNQYYHLDALGSTTDLTDDVDTTKAKASYFLNPWGMILETLGDSVNRRVFTGKEIDKNTGLVYFGARYYDPDAARFTTQDSYLGEQGVPPSLHRYLYAYSNPLAYLDPDGHAGYFFGGTGNHLNDTNYDGSKNIKTNVEKLYKAYADEAFYAYGIGSGFNADGTPYDKKWHGGTGRKIIYEQITGESMDARVTYMMEKLKGQLEKGDKIVDVYGFSRGSASGLDFLNRIQDQIKKGNELYKDINIRFVGLFDAVPSKRSGLFGYSNEDQVPTGEKNWLGFEKTRTVKYNFNLPKDMKFSATPVHAVSIDEQRKEFATVDLEGALQVGFRGVHADVGGGYANSSFDWIALDYMVKQSEAAHVKFHKKELDRVERNGYEPYMNWLNRNVSATRSDARTYDNSEVFYNDNEPRKLPKNMLLHPSVDYFKTTPKNDIGGYRYLP